MSVLDDLKEAQERAKEHTCSYELPRVYMTAAQLIHAFKTGVMSPGDRSVEIMMSVHGFFEVEEFLKTFEGGKWQR